jgi:hypothetical protein
MTIKCSSNVGATQNLLSFFFFSVELEDLLKDSFSMSTNDNGAPESPALKPLYYDVSFREKGKIVRDIKIRISPSSSISDLVTEVFQTVFSLTYVKRTIHDSGNGSHVEAVDAINGRGVSRDSSDGPPVARLIGGIVVSEEEAHHYDALLGRFLKSITSITCANTRLECFLGDPDALLCDLNSKATPLVEEPLVINTKSSVDIDHNAKKDLINAFDYLMNKAASNVFYLPVPVLTDGSNLTEQITASLLNLYKEKKVGYTDAVYYAKMKAYTSSLAGTLCFVHEYWEVLLNKPFPQTTKGTSELVKSITECTRLGNR